jgi:hypothetical protein
MMKCDTSYDDKPVAPKLEVNRRPAVSGGELTGRFFAVGATADGHPGLSDDGRPVGLQLVARHEAYNFSPPRRGAKKRLARSLVLPSPGEILLCVRLA